MDDSVTRLDDSWNLLATIFLAKVAQIFGDFLAKFNISLIW